MKLIVDDKIPYISHFFANCDNVIYLPGEAISSAHLCDADILLIRTVTRVDQSLLENTAIQFVGTATTGTDHIDISWLKKQNITLATAAGANAQAVADYIAFCVAALEMQGKLQHKKVVGIIGCGRIGRLVAAFFQMRGFEVICYDPLLIEKLPFNFTSLDNLVNQSDIISIHTPLTKTGAYPTFHLLNDALLQKIKPNAILFNTARGSVIDESALLNRNDIALCIDVWENEPHISLELLNTVFIGTPHIAGYSMQAKYRATQMLYEAAATYFGWSLVAQPPIEVKRMSTEAYDPLAHTQEFRDAFRECKTKNDIEKRFIGERKKYPLR